MQEQDMEQEEMLSEEAIEPEVEKPELEPQEALLGDDELSIAEAVDEEERLRTALEEADERYLRLAAEYDNYRKRTAKEKSEIYPLAAGETITKFLPVLDNFERSLGFEPGTEDFAKGLEMIHRGFKEALDSLGVEAFGEVGEPFDPDRHNAIMHIEDPELSENVVAMVLQKGYKMGDRIIRHAMVQTAN